MSANKQLFKFGESSRVWNLEEIEDMYTCNLITSESTVFISDGHDSDFTAFKMETLINLYGEEYPFRRQEILLGKSRNEMDFASSDESSQGSPVQERRVRKKSVVLNETKNEYFEYERKETGESCSTVPDDAKSEVSSEPEIKFRPMQHIDVPLLNSRYENENDILTSRQIEIELDELKKIAPLPWKMSNNANFSDLNKTEDQMVLCRFCSFIPYTAKCLFEHMFSPDHRKKLVQERISRSSFEYWHQRFDSAASQGVAKSAKKQAKAFQRIPLLSGDKNPDKSEPLGSSFNFPKLSNLVAQVDKNKVNDENGFHYAFMREVGWPSGCSFCPSCSFTENDPYAVITHIVSPSHIAALTQNGFLLKDYSFWFQYLQKTGKVEKETIVEVVKKTETQKVTKPKIQKAKNNSSTYQFIRVPLLTEIPPKHSHQMKKSKRIPSLKRLDVLLRSVDKIKFNAMNSNCSKVLNTIVFTKESCGFGCKPLRSTDPYALISHCLTSPHREKLLHVGFSVVEFEFWSNMLAQYTKAELTVEEVEDDGETSSITDSIRSSISATVKDLKFNSPRIPLLDLNSEHVYPEKERKGLLAELNTMWKIVDAKKFKLAGDKILDYNRESTCYVCKLRENCFTDAVSLGSHVFSPSHTKHILSRGFSSEDYFVWKNCLTRALTGDIPKTVTVKQEKPQSKPAVVTTPVIQTYPSSSDVPIIKKETVKQSQTSSSSRTIAPNSPRVPLLDSPPPDNKSLSKDQIEKEFTKLKEKVKSVLEKTAVKMYGSTKKSKLLCTFCKNKSKPFSFENIVSAGRHVLSPTHREQMECGVSQSDFDFWNSLYDKCIEQQGVVKPKRVFVDESPRIPLLDLPIPGEQLLSKDSVEREFAKLILKEQNVPDRTISNAHPPDKKFILQCRICKDRPKPFVFPNLTAVGKHVLSAGHRNQMGCNVSQSDFDYWNDIYDAVKTDEKKKSEKEMKQKERENEKKRREEPNTPNKPNYPRIPLLDLPLVAPGMPLELDHDFGYKFAVLRNKWEFTLPAITENMLKNKKVFCNICFECDGAFVEMKSLRDIGDHVFSTDTHLHKINLDGRATEESFNYWDDIFKRINIMESKQNNQINSTRIPLLDKPLSNMPLIDVNEIDKVYAELKEYRVQCGNNYELNACLNNKIQCFVCYGNDGYTIGSSKLLINHILSAVHNENIKKVGVSAEDVIFWRELANKPVKKGTKRNFFALGLMYANIDHTLIPFLKKQVLNEKEVAEKFVELRTKIEKVPVFDFNVRFKNLPMQHDRKDCSWCGKVFYAPSHILQHVASAEHEKNVLKYCKVTRYDFDEWFDRIKILDELLLHMKMRAEFRKSPNKSSTLSEEEIVRSTPPPSTSAQKPAEVVKKPAPTKKLMNNEPAKPPESAPDNRPLFQKFPERYVPGQERYTLPIPACRSPLFVERRDSGKLCSGPSVEEIEFIEKSHAIFDRGADLDFGCAVCNVDLQYFSAKDFVRHVFSVTHLKKLTDLGVKLYVEDFLYWTKFFTLKTNTRFNSKMNINLVSRFDASKPLTGPMFTPGFLDSNGPRAQLTNSLLQLAERLDCIKFDLSSNVFVNFKPSGCQYCNKWLFTPSDVAKHCVSHEHFLNFQKRGAFISRAELMHWVDEMKKFQLPADKGCVVM